MAQVVVAGGAGQVGEHVRQRGVQMVRPRDLPPVVDAVLQDAGDLSTASGGMKIGDS
ncbi:MAG TPA: hypothetical protein VHR72_01765 [Gemmataceae bacterium]|jgi:hypothetical protein|nr:hypothetical protein [Gemmataceae bacterium]